MTWLELREKPQRESSPYDVNNNMAARGIHIRDRRATSGAASVWMDKQSAAYPPYWSRANPCHWRTRPYPGRIADVRIPITMQPTLQWNEYIPMPGWWTHRVSIICGLKIAWGPIHIVSRPRIMLTVVLLWPGWLRINSCLVL